MSTVPRFTVDLDAPADTRWLAVVDAYKGQMRRVDAFLDDLAPGWAAKLAARVVESSLAMAARAGLVYCGSELIGIARHSGMPLGRLVMMQLVYEASAMCTAFVVPREGGEVLHFRTMDWEMDFLKDLTIEVTFVRGGVPVAAASTWAGYVGILTGVAMRPNSEGFSASVNFRHTGTGTLKTNAMRMLRSCWPAGFLVRETLLNAPNGPSARGWLESSSLIAPCYFTMGCARPHEGHLITRDRSAADVQSVSASGCIVQPNMDHWSNNPEDDIFYSRRRRECGRAAVQRLAAADRVLTEAEAWRVLSQSPIMSSITIYGTVMCPATGFIETRLPRDRSFVLPP